MLSRIFYLYLHLLFLFLSFSLSNHANAGIDIKVAELHKSASQQQLWLNPEWLNLLHYNKSGSKFISHVDDTDFFNAADGKTNPEAELLATLSAFYNTASPDDQHPQCRFLARLDWLNRQLDNRIEELPATNCSLYKEWRTNIPDAQLTLVFPAYHLNSPSSMFGHTLLRLDPANLDTGSEWLSIAVNFGANISPDDNSILYAFKGLAGGYPGFFIVTPYFKKIREYNRDENRDIWEYQLNLRPAEIQKMVTHLWELRETEFDYYFFDENCSYRLLELLEVARPGIELTEAFGLTAIPVDTVRAIEKSGLIHSVSYRPSQVTVLQNLINQIPNENHGLVTDITDDPGKLTSAEFQSLEPTQQRQVVDVAYKLLRYRQGTGARDDVSAKNSYQLLEKLNQYPITTPDISYNAIQPEAGHLSNRLTLLGGSISDMVFAEIGYRMSFHSLEDNISGFLQGAQINLGNLQVRAYEDVTIQVQQFDVVDIFSLTPRSAFLSPLSWRIYTGLERQFTNDREVLTAHVTGGAGVAYAPIENNLFYLMASLRLENNSEFDDSIEPALGALTGMLHHFKNSTAHLQISAEEFANDETRYNAHYNHNFVVSTNHAMRIYAKRLNHEDIYYTEAGLGYQYYF